MFIQHFEETLDDRFAAKSDLLATKVDLAQSESRLIKWMFIFLIGHAAAIISIITLL